MSADIVYVDRDDREIGSGTIRHAVEHGIVRRVVRVIIENDAGEILLQKRSATIVSYPNLWNDSTSGHVDVGESYAAAAARELKEEMGIEVPLTEVGKFYGEETEPPHLRKAFNMVYRGVFNGEPRIDPHEVGDARWVSRAELRAWYTETPGDFTPGSIESFEFYFARRDPTRVSS